MSRFDGKQNEVNQSQTQPNIWFSLHLLDVDQIFV